MRTHTSAALMVARSGLGKPPHDATTEARAASAIDGTTNILIVLPNTATPELDGKRLQTSYHQRSTIHTHQLYANNTTACAMVCMCMSNMRACVFMCAPTYNL